VGDVVVDASVWVSALVARDRHHERSRAWLNRQAGEAALTVTPALALPEIAGAISRRTGQATLATRAVSWLLRLPTLRLVPVDHRLADDAASLAGRLRLRGADATYVAVAYRLGVPLVTWDDEQRQRAAPLVTVHTAV
jgi:predicted nucleic acid-binding protein